MKNIAIVLWLLALTGCATQQPTQLPSSQYSERYSPIVMEGKMKYSDYYKGLYDAINQDGGATSGDAMLLINDLIGTALKFESNAITKDEFDNERRIAKAKLAKIDSDYMIKMQQIQASRPPPEPYIYKPYIQRSRPVQRPQQTNCTTYGVKQRVKLSTNQRPIVSTFLSC